MSKTKAKDTLALRTATGTESSSKSRSNTRRGSHMCSAQQLGGNKHSDKCGSTGGTSSAFNTQRSTSCDVIVVGAGAAGLACAITAAQHGRTVTVLEAGDPGHSIRVTGDGRCNIANTNTAGQVYWNTAFVEAAFSSCAPEESLRFLERCGIVMRAEAEGRLYPLANKASSVVEALLLAANRAGVAIQSSVTVEAVQRSGSGLTVSAHRGDKPILYRAQAVVLCCGGAIEKISLPTEIACIPTSPLLGPLACQAAPLRGLDKVRAKCAVTCEGVREEGEVTFRTYGVSGIAAFNVSRVAHPGSILSIDFLPAIPAESALSWAQERSRALGVCTWREWCTGAFLPLIARALLTHAHISADTTVEEQSLQTFMRVAKSFDLIVKGIGDVSRCQVTRGGIEVSMLNPTTMETPVKHVYACGESLDVDAPCGGYNLHWAWTSGLIAGRALANCPSAKEVV
ncbi:predicted flavoprotein [Cryptobacterium curtum DSM 15641]|uniref:Predicted flavoprotein n=1 Tax=Cryptobacterium curtum (strain ATCC 700683 / DSM 15641 / CCUG 43107 / 12-3) TaxID=469378 RepID=C7MKV8_CRYCD|nr:aminoacetone oxidase family FAD-binding enzyme [Cryptobacterium curtum]ACU94905.1 predicted flavoprotein [Cryptobacterium curtum DSM 15641]